MIVEVPGPTTVIRPVDAFTVATDVLLLENTNGELLVLNGTLGTNAETPTSARVILKLPYRGVALPIVMVTLPEIDSSVAVDACAIRIDAVPAPTMETRPEDASTVNTLVSLLEKVKAPALLLVGAAITKGSAPNV